MTKHFPSLGAFALHLAGRRIAIRAELELGLEKVIKRIEETAKSEFGVYQPAQGSFPAWAPLAEATQDERAKLGFTPDDPLYRAGDLQEAVTHQVHRAALAGAVGVLEGKLGDVMAAQEFGTSRIPPRPVLGPAGYRNVDTIRKLAGAAVLAGLIGPEQVHAALGYDQDVEPI